MSKPTTSLIITVLNEEVTISQLLEAIAAQTLKANEVIITDGGSTDRTQLIITQFAQAHPQLKIQLVQRKGNRSIGRNEAIQHAHGELIAITDAGCVPHRDWLEELVHVAIVRGAEEPDFLVAGYYDAQPKTPFEEAVVPYVLVMPDRVDPEHFLPATRSMLMTKSIWEKFGGFDESLGDNEDYAFSRKIAQSKVPIYFAAKAKVTWIPRQSLEQFLNMIYRFARGDAYAGIFRPKVAALFGRYVVFLALAMVVPMLFVLAWVAYLGWSIFKNYRYVPHGWYWLPVLQLGSDVMVMAGSLAGVLHGSKK